jgi:hypothetical protein
MKINEFYEIIANESLDMPLIDEVPNNRILTYGYYREQNNFVAYRTNERAGIFLTKKCSSEDEVLQVLLKWLRNKKIMEEG